MSHWSQVRRRGGNVSGLVEISRPSHVLGPAGALQPKQNSPQRSKRSSPVALLGIAALCAFMEGLISVPAAGQVTDAPDSVFGESGRTYGPCQNTDAVTSNICGAFYELNGTVTSQIAIGRVVSDQVDANGRLLYPDLAILP